MAKEDKTYPDKCNFGHGILNSTNTVLLVHVNFSVNQSEHEKTSSLKKNEWTIVSFQIKTKKKMCNQINVMLQIVIIQEILNQILN